MDQREKSLASARRALEKTAQRNGVTLETVLKEIQLAIINGISNPDPQIQAEWAKIPRAGEYPTPEEVVAYYAKLFSS